MRAIASEFECVSPRNLQDALKELNESITPIAGGTDLMVLFEAGKLPAGKYLNLWPLKELKEIRETQTHFEMGALTTYSQIRNSTPIQKHFPLLCEAAKVTGAIAIQNRGTLGGNIINASPAADSPPALLVYEAEVQLSSTSGSRWVDYKHFHKDYKKTERSPKELLTQIRLKKSTYTQSYYRKVGTRQAQAISKVCMAAVKHGEKYRIAFGAVAPIPLRCSQTERVLEGKPLNEQTITRACETLLKEISPIGDIRSTQAYRARVAVNLLRAYLECGIGQKN